MKINTAYAHARTHAYAHARTRTRSHTHARKVPPQRLQSSPFVRAPPGASKALAAVSVGPINLIHAAVDALL